MTTTAPDTRYEYQYGPPSKYRAAITAGLVIALVVALAAGLQAWQRWTQRAPYGPEAVHARVTMSVVPEAEAQAAVDALTGAPGSLQIPVGMGPLLVGQLTFDVPPGARESDVSTLFLLDAHQGLPLEHVYAVSSAGGVGQGWDGSFDAVAKQVPWLAGIASTQLPDGSWTSTGMAAMWRAPTPGPVTFVAVPLPDMLDPTLVTSYTVGLMLWNEDRALYWAEQLTPTSG